MIRIYNWQLLHVNIVKTLEDMEVSIRFDKVKIGFKCATNPRKFSTAI